MKKSLKKLHRYVLIACMAFWYILFSPLLFYFAAKPARYKHMIWLRKLWAFLSSAFAGIFYRFRFEQPVDWNRTYIICPNHASNLDISTMSILLGHTDCCFMGKDNLRDELLTGVYFKTIDLPVNRDSKIAAFKAFKTAAAKLNDGINMILFPEGGIADIYPPVINDFKNGPFRLAIELKIPIIPVTSLNTWKLFWDDGAKYGSRPGICDIYVHSPIETKDMTIDDADSLKERVYHIIKQKFETHEYRSGNR